MSKSRKLIRVVQNKLTPVHRDFFVCLQKDIKKTFIKKHGEDTVASELKKLIGVKAAILTLGEHVTAIHRSTSELLDTDGT